jgi:hypothetical protein
MHEFLHIISVYKSDISWIYNLKGKSILYHKDSPKLEPYNNINICGAETNILKFIIQFYYLLPEICVFTHPYNNKWTHEGNLYDIVNNLYDNKDSLLNFGSLSHLKYDDISNKEINYNFMKNSNWWNETMQEYFGDMPPNFSLGKSQSSQFYVKKNTIHRLPITFYLNMYKFLITKSIKGTLYNKNNMFNEYWMSRYMEWSWEFIFTTQLLN